MVIFKTSTSFCTFKRTLSDFYRRTYVSANLSTMYDFVLQRGGHSVVPLNKLFSLSILSLVLRFQSNIISDNAEEVADCLKQPDQTSIW